MRTREKVVCSFFVRDLARDVPPPLAPFFYFPRLWLLFPCGNFRPPPLCILILFCAEEYREFGFPRERGAYYYPPKPLPRIPPLSARVTLASNDKHNFISPFYLFMRGFPSGTYIFQRYATFVLPKLPRGRAKNPRLRLKTRLRPWKNFLAKKSLSLSLSGEGCVPKCDIYYFNYVKYDYKRGRERVFAPLRGNKNETDVNFH